MINQLIDVVVDDTHIDHNLQFKRYLLSRDGATKKNELYFSK